MSDYYNGCPYCKAPTTQDRSGSFFIQHRADCNDPAWDEFDNDQILEISKRSETPKQDYLSPEEFWRRVEEGK